MQECFKDAALRDAIMAMPADVEPADHAVKIASTRGYAFTAADVQTYYDNQKTREENGELPDWELEAVAGGAGTKPGPGPGPGSQPNWVGPVPRPSKPPYVLNGQVIKAPPPRPGGGNANPGRPLPRPKPPV